MAALAALERTAFSDPWTRAQLATALDWPGALAMVAEDDDEIVGYVLGRVIVDEGEILSIATRPTRRREGIGRQLLDAITGTMAAAGAHAAWLEVRMSNEAARTMYRSAGFAPAGIRPGYYRRPDEDALILRCELPAAASPGPALR
ncbi:MAG: ribosomal protein S18-alanine N-acetyltransferase [Gemmatimonadales bacterium]